MSSSTSAARIRQIQIWRWPQPEVTLEKKYCKMNIVTSFLVLFIDLFYFFLFYLYYLFILHSRHLKEFVFYFRALGEPFDQDSVPVGQSLKYTSIKKIYAKVE